MKKKLGFLSILLTSISLVGCGSNSPINQKQVDELKALLNKQDLSPFYKRMFSALYNQSYSSYSNNVYEDGEDIEFFRYYGVGGYGYYYSVSEEDYEEIMSKDNVNPFDFMTKGESAYDIRQSLDINIYSFEKDNEELIINESKENLKYWQSFIAKSSEGNFQVDSQLTINDYLKGSEEKLDFNGLISNSLLLDTVSTEVLNDLVLRISMFDGQRNTEFLDNLYYDVCKSLLTKNDLELSNFINVNHINIAEGEEYTELTFKIEDENIKNILSENEIFPGLIQGTLFYDKETGEFKSYAYDITYMDNEIDSNGEAIRSTTLNFTCTGFSYHDTHESSIYVRPNPEIYEDGNTYINDLTEKVIPEIY